MKGAVRILEAEIERRRRVLLVEISQLAEELTDDPKWAQEVANRAIERLARKRRVEIGFRF